MEDRRFITVSLSRSHPPLLTRLSLSSHAHAQAELAAQWLALDGGVKAEVRRLLLSTLGSQVRGGRERKEKTAACTGPAPIIIHPHLFPALLILPLHQTNSGHPRRQDGRPGHRQSGCHRPARPGVAGAGAVPAGDDGPSGHAWGPRPARPAPHGHPGGPGLRVRGDGAAGG